jgi:hypothetical protein
MRLAGHAGAALGSLEDVVKFNTNEINVFLVDPLAKELTRVRVVACCWPVVRVDHVAALRVTVCCVHSLARFRR